MSDPDFVILPFKIVVDTREQTPWHFKSIETKETVVRTVQEMQGKVKKRVVLVRPLVVFTKTATLRTGDYSIEGYEESFCIERKSLDDALNTFTAGRERFERELERMVSFRFAAVVMEFSEKTLLALPADRKVSPESIEGSVRAWRQRYGVHFFWAQNRALAEIAAMKECVQFWNDLQSEEKTKIKWRVK